MKSIKEIQDDLHLFMAVQTEKYFQRTGKIEFSGEAEIKSVLELIFESYNNRIAPDKLRLDNLNDAAKKEWFRSIEIDWPAKTQGKEIPKQKEGSLYQDVSDLFDKTFDFLPSGSLDIMLHAGAALDAVNFSMERYNEFLLGTLKPNDEEKEAIEWAYDVSLCLLAAESEHFQSQKKEFYMNAVDLLQDYLTEKEAIIIARKITRSIKEMFKPDPVKRKKKK